MAVLQYRTLSNRTVATLSVEPQKSNLFVVRQRIQSNFLDNAEVETAPLNALLRNNWRTVRVRILRRLPALNVRSQNAEAGPLPRRWHIE